MARTKKADKTASTAPTALTAPGTFQGLVLPEDMDYEEWKQLVRQLKAEGEELMRHTTHWQFEVGDVVNLGERLYGDSARRFIEEEGMTYSAVHQYAWVARQIPASQRRLDIPFAHHRLVARLPAREQKKWLDKAKANALPTRTLAEMMRAEGVFGRRRKFGGPLNFRGLQYEPIGELGVVFLFGMVARELGFHVEAVAGGFPDCTAKRKQPGGHYEQVEIEFEFKASHYRRHKHDRDKRQCDLLVCWEDDWHDCPVEVVALREEIQKL